MSPNAQPPSDPNGATREKLIRQFQAEVVDIVDNSWQHAGHVAMKDEARTSGTHLCVWIVSSLFKGVPTIQRHRQVQKALAEEFENGLHALEIKALTPDEAAQRFASPSGNGQ